MMFVHDLKPGESLRIGKQTVIKLLRQPRRGGSARIGIHTPKRVMIRVGKVPLDAALPKELI